MASFASLRLPRSSLARRKARRSSLPTKRRKRWVLSVPARALRAASTLSVAMSLADLIGAIDDLATIWLDRPVDSTRTFPLASTTPG